MHQALYRKWRPAVFDDVYGQDHITSVLKYEITNNKTSHAYLFCGSRGTGKTTCAKILAKAVNCLNPQNGNPCGVCKACNAVENGITTDILEMDAASNTGVDYIRDIRDEVVYPPSMLNCRVYIIDEVHMLSSGAFNALLKTLEEPPSQVIFILATTEPHKIPATILSRCQKFDFRRINSRVIAGLLKKIALSENIETDDESIQLIAKLSQGGMRDAISLLELCSGDGKKITAETVAETAGIVGRGHVEQTIRAVIAADYEQIFSIIAELYASSKDINVFWQDIISYYRDIMVAKSTRNSAEYLDLTDSEFESLKDISSKLRMETLIEHTKLLDDALAAMQNGRTSASKRLTAELTLIRMANGKLSASNESLLARLSALEDRVAMGTNIVQHSNGADCLQGNSIQEDINNYVPEDNKAELPPDFKISDKKSIKAIGWWADAIGKLAVYDQMAASFYSNAKAYKVVGDNKIIIQADSKFKLQQMERDENRTQIAGIMNTFEAIFDGGKKIMPNDVVFILSQNGSGNDDEYKIIDEIIERKDEI